jgi:hypothetical protein
MGCGLAKTNYKIQRSTAIEILDKTEAEKLEGVSMVECEIEGRKTKIYYKRLYSKVMTNSKKLKTRGIFNLT